MGEALEQGRQALPGPLGTALGALGAVPAGFGQLGEQAALGAGFTPEQAEAQGRLAAIVSPGLGGLEQGSRRLGQVATAGLGGVGAVKGALETEGGLGERAAGALEGGLNWAQFGQPVGALADLARVLPYRLGTAAAGAADEGALGIRRGQRFREAPLTPEQQAQRSRDGAAEQRVFDAIARLWRAGPDGEAAADDLRFLAVGKGEAGEAAAREYLAGKGLEEVLPPPPAAAAAVAGAPATDGSLLGLARRATSPLMARAAQTPGERAFDVAAGTAGGLGAAATADEDATWQERLGRGLAGASLGALGGANLRQLGRVGRGALADETLGAAAGRTLLPSDREAMRRATAAGRAAPPEVVERLASLQDEAAAVATGTDPARRASLLGNVLEVFNNYSLAGPLSLLTNLTGGLTQTALNVGEAVGAAGPRGALRYARGAAGAVPRALREGGRVFVEGTQARGTPLGGTTQELAVAGGLSEGRGLARTVGSWATRLNAATDRAIWAVNDAGARQVGEQLGFTGQRLEDFAKRYAEEATYAGKPSALGELLTKARGTLSDPDAGAADRLWGGFVYALAPYIRVPERILRQAGDLTTLGAANWNKLLAKDPAVRAHARGRIGAATATTLAIAYQAAQGAVTGDGPQDPDERAALEARTNEAGDPLWRRNSFRVEVPGAGPGGTARLFWFPNRALGAVGTQMDLIANAVDAYERERAESGEGPGAAWTGGKALVNEVVATALGDSWLDDMLRFGERSKKGQFLEATGEQLAGFAGRPLAVAAPLARATDPYAREVQRGDVVGRVLERLPFARETLPARVDPTTGEPVRQGGTPLQRAVGATPPVATAPRAETARLASLKGPDGTALYPGVLPRVFDEPEVTYAGATQTPAQKRVLQQAYGSETGRYLGLLLAGQAYRDASDAEKAEMVQRALRTVAKEADVRAGSRIARDPKNRAAWEYLAVPHYAGVDPKASPDEIRRQNLRIAEARAQLAAFRARYPQQPQRGEAELAQADRELYALAKRPPVPPAYLEAQREAIRKRVGVTPDADPADVILAGAVRP